VVVEVAALGEGEEEAVEFVGRRVGLEVVEDGAGGGGVGARRGDGEERERGEGEESGGGAKGGGHSEMR
jgi:hypothetical protein